MGDQVGCGVGRRGSQGWGFNLGSPVHRLRSRGGHLRPLSPARQDAVCWEQSSRPPVQPGREAQAWDPTWHLSALVWRLQPAGETSLPGGPSLPAWGKGN